MVEIQQEREVSRELGPVSRMNDPQADPPTHRVLVIEADAVQRALLVRALENSGYSVDAVDSSDRALDAFRRCLYGVVLLDCDDPPIRGFETAAALRQLDSDSKRTPIIALTANIGQKYRRQRKAAGIRRSSSKASSARPAGTDPFALCTHQQPPQWFKLSFAG